VTSSRIMIVEDERITAEAVKGTLEELGYVVCAIVATAPEAIARAGEERPDLVLMDIVLRGPMDGIEAAEQVRSAYGTPIVYATAYADESFLRRARVTAPYGYILKPFSTRELHSNIEMALHKSQLDRRIARQNAVLDTMRRVNQLVIREHTQDRLLQRVCELLVKHGGYSFAWVVVFDEAGKLLRTAQAGLGEAQFQPMVELLRRGEQPSCFAKARARAGGVLISLRSTDCPDCPLRGHYPDAQALTVQLGQGSRTPGLLSAGAPARVTIDEAESALFGELAGDISVALHAINAETERNEAEKALRQAQKLEAVGQLAVGVAHDFNNLLTAICGYADLAGQALPATHPSRDALRGIEVAVQQATGVSRGLLTFSGRSVSQKEVVILQRLVRDSSKLLHHLLPALIQLEVDAPAEPVLAVCADATQLHQVLMNLAVNARDAMPDGGQLRIAISAVPATGLPEVAPQGSAVERKACITVSDTGTGMTPEVLAHIFEPFFTTKPRGTGTGLGLAIIHRIVLDHGGRLEVQSTPGAGSTFRVYLPCVAPTADAQHGLPEWPKIAGQWEVVLLAEDDQYVRELIASALKTCQYAVVQVRDGAELWDRYQQLRGTLGLLIIDVDLPRRSGLDCLQAIRATRDRVPAIVITAQSEIADDALDPSDLLLRKPFTLSELLRIAAQVIGAGQPKEGMP